jgi:hypothetical protein
MKMQVLNGLSRIGPRVRHQPVSARQPALLRYLARRAQTFRDCCRRLGIHNLIN